MQGIDSIKSHAIEWIREWFEQNGKNCTAVIGMSGGKDSTVCAALCAEALGKERVIGVMMPDEGQGTNDAENICKYLGIRCINYPINTITKAIKESFDQNTKIKDVSGAIIIHPMSRQSEQNIPPRVRMTVLFAIAQTYDGRVCCTDNASENFLGYSTFGGDDLGAFAPLGNLTVTEVRAIGKHMNLPEKWVMKVPDDGLPGSSSDEEKFGFTYDVLDKYLMGKEVPEDIASKIENMHVKTQFKRDIIRVPAYDPKRTL